MSENGNETESTVSRDGITVHQTYQEERFGVPTVVLKFVSERDESAGVRIAVDLPPDLHIEEVGFHPEYGYENWTVDSDRLTFAAEIGPDEEVTTMYAIESPPDDRIDALLDSLTIERVTGDAAASEFGPQPSVHSEHSTGMPTEEMTAEDLQNKVGTATEDDDREGTAADGTEVGDPAEEPTTDASDEAKKVEGEDEDGDGDERKGKEAVTGEESGAQAGSDDDSDEIETVSQEEAGEVGRTVARSTDQELSEYSTAILLAELDGRVQAGELTDEDRDQLYELLLRGAESGTISDELRVAHLQKRVSDVEAGMETASEKVEELLPRLDEIEEHVESLAEGQKELESKVSALQEWHEDVTSTLGALGDR